jgi:hypothetical protein
MLNPLVTGRRYSGLAETSNGSQHFFWISAKNFSTKPFQTLLLEHRIRYGTDRFFLNGNLVADTPSPTRVSLNNIFRQSGIL